MDKILETLRIVARWKFLEKFSRQDASDHDKAANKKELFDERSEAKTKSLVDEMNQNSLDGGCNSGVSKIDKKITKITYRYIDYNQMTSGAKKFLKRFKKELDDETVGLSPVSDCCKRAGMDEAILVVEDYNTTGLTGGYKQKEYVSVINGLSSEGVADTERFFGLHYLEGESPKSGASHTAGSRGLGKEVLTKSSQLCSYITLTQRYDDGKKLLFGQTIFDSPIVKGDRMTENYFHYGIREDDKKGGVKFVNAYDDTKEIDRFCKEMGITRDEPGTSQIILEPRKELHNVKHFLKAICERWWLPIHRKKLEINLEGFPATSKPVTAETLKEHLKDQNCIKEIEAMDYLDKFEKIPEQNIVTAREDAVADKKLSPDDFEPDDVQKLKTLWSEGTPGQIKVPILLKPKNKEKVFNYLKINFMKANGLMQQHYFIRDLLIITSALQKVERINDCFFYVEPEGDFLCMFVKNAENVSHNTLDGNRTSIERLFEFGYVDNLRKDHHIRAILNLLENCVKELHQSIFSEQRSDDIDETMFSDLLALDFEGATTGTVRVEQDKEEEDEEDEDEKSPDDIKPIKKTKKNIFTLNTYKDGNETRFEVLPNHLSDEEPVGKKIKVSVKSVDQMGGTNSIYQRETTYFNLPNLVMKHEGIKILKQENNHMNFEIEKKGFKLEMAGYDPLYHINVFVNEVSEDQ